MSRLFVLVAAVAMCCGESLNAQEQQPVSGAGSGSGQGFILIGSGKNGGAGIAIAADAALQKAPAVDFEAILDRPVKPEFADTPLADVVDFLAGQFDINIQLDEKGLTDAAVDPSVPVTFSLRKPIPFRSVLKLILDRLDVTFTVQDEVLLITSKEKADELLTTEVYYVGDLTGARLSSTRKWGPLMQLITSTVQPDSWNDNGGPGSIQPFATGDALVISQRADIQRELKDLFAKLRDELKENKVAAQVPVTEPFAKAYSLNAASGEQTAESFRKLVAPKTWKENGGEGEISVITRTVAATEDNEASTADVLLVRQTADVHQQIEDLLVSANLITISDIMRAPARMGGGMGGGVGGGSVGGAHGGTGEAPAQATDKP